MDKVLITGTTSGLGASLAEIYEDGGYSVHSISKKEPKSSAVHRDCDLEDLDSVRRGIDSLVKTHCYEYVFLNAGVLGELAVGADVHLRDYEKAFDVNVWSNKIIIDSLIKHKRAKNIICLSSGAASKGYFGWSIYCSTKGAMKQLMSCYHLEYPDIKFLSLAPGLIKTKMQDYICSHDENELPSVKKFKDAYSTMQTPEDCARKIYNGLEEILSKGVDYFDLRGVKEK